MASNYGLKMVYYHVYIVYEDQKGIENTHFLYDYTEEGVKKSIATPYMENGSLQFAGTFVHASKVSCIHIFWSETKWATLILPNRKKCLDEYDNRYIVSCFLRQRVAGVKYITYYFITSPPQAEEEPKKMSIRLMESAGFLGVDDNWSLATCALQLQEIAVTLVAKRKKIDLGKASIEKILNKKIQKLSFSDQYEAFSARVYASFAVKMPILATHLRKMRAKVLHEGYNPKPEETESIAGFTIGLLEKLRNID